MPIRRTRKNSELRFIGRVTELERIVQRNGPDMCLAHYLGGPVAVFWTLTDHPKSDVPHAGEGPCPGRYV